MLPIRGKKKPANMVKAPRSKGCRVCVQRRIKCDQTRPHCLRCQRANRECPGFETTTFVDEGPSIKAFYETSSKEQSRDRYHSDSGDSSSSSPSAMPEDDDFVGFLRMQQEQPMKRFSTPINAENWEPDAFERTAMINLICPTAHQIQILADFINTIRQPVQAPTFRCHSTWLQEVAMCSDQSSSLIWAVRAISISHLSRLTGDQNLIETSRRVYGKALVQLNAALQNPAEGLSSNTLSATLLLSFYEIFNCTERHSWIRHAGGAGHLIRLRGPARHRTGIGRTIFIACRYSLIIECFQTRKPCFLNAPEWRALGWEIHRQLKRENPGVPFLESTEHFFQEMVTHPAYLHSATKAVTNPNTNPSHLQSLIAKGQNHRSTYQAIHASMMDELRAQGVEPIKAASSYSDRVFPVVYDFPDLHIASFFVGYWACLCAINVILIGLEAKLASTDQKQRQQHQQSLSHQQLPLKGPRKDPASYNLQSKKSTASASGYQEKDPTQPPANRHLWDIAASATSQPSPNMYLYLAENATYAREICKSAEAMDSTTFIGPLFLVIALRMALRMGITRREKLWVLNKLATIGKRMGIAKSEVEIYWSQKARNEGDRSKEDSKQRDRNDMSTSMHQAGSRNRNRGGVGMSNTGATRSSEDDSDEDDDNGVAGLDPVGPPGMAGMETNAVRDDWNPLVLDVALGGSNSNGSEMGMTTASTSMLGENNIKMSGYVRGDRPDDLITEIHSAGVEGAIEQFGAVGSSVIMDSEGNLPCRRGPGGLGR